MTLVNLLKKTATQHGSKFYNLSFIIIIFRFGSSVRKDNKRMQAPGPGGHEYKSYTDSGTKHQLQRRLNEGELKEYRAAIYKKDDGLGPGQYNAQMA